MLTGSYQNFKINERKIFMNPAIVHMSSSVATLRFGCCAKGNVAVYPEPVEGHSCTVGNSIQQKDESKKIEFAPQEHLFVKI